LPQGFALGENKQIGAEKFKTSILRSGNIEASHPANRIRRQHCSVCPRDSKPAEESVCAESVFNRENNADVLAHHIPQPAD
jgi:hypothetical protein